MKKSIAKLYEKYTSGDSFTTDELRALYRHFHQTSTLLFGSGPVFRLSAVEAQKVSEFAKQALQARGKSLTSE